MGGSSNGGGGNTVTTTKSDPWTDQQPYLLSGFTSAQNNYNQGGPQYYPDSTIAPLSNNTNQAISASANLGNNGNPLVNAGQNQLTSTVNGAYLNSNPYLDQNFAAGSDAITKAYNDAVNGQTSGFAGGNRTGSGMQAFYQNQQNDTLAKNLNNLYSQTYYDNYNNERQNQLSATQLAPTYDATQLQNIDALSNAGSAQDTYNQNLLNSNIDRYNYNQNLPTNTLNQYLNQIQGNYGGSASSSGTYTPTYSSSNLFGNTLSGAATGAALGSFIPGIGTAAGALGGGVFGGLGSLFSDRRLKFNIVKIGEASNGLNIYRYQYTASPQNVHIGFMADEVEKLHPSAVTVDEATGYKKVDYGIATSMKGN